MSGTISMMGQSTKEEYTNVYLKYDTEVELYSWIPIKTKHFTSIKLINKKSNENN